MPYMSTLYYQKLHFTKKEGSETNMSEECEWVCEKCGLVYFKDVGVCNVTYEDGVCRGKLRKRRKAKP
jgi:hypothetical protein